jgi:hypothetical protein
MCALANNFVDFGFTVFLDTVLVDRAELDFFNDRGERLWFCSPLYAGLARRGEVLGWASAPNDARTRPDHKA